MPAAMVTDESGVKCENLRDGYDLSRTVCRVGSDDMTYPSGLP